jgi:uncharacterized delta-60 repeat protein
MSLAKIEITLDIQNNTNYPQEINVLGSPYNLLDTVNATTEYRWNVTGFTFTTETNVSVQYRSTSQVVYSNYISGLASQTLQSVVDALNGLQIGYFNLYTELGQTYIGTYNQNYVFGNLNIYQPSLLNPAFYSGTGFNNTTSGVTSNLTIVGNFTSYDGTLANRIIRLNADGSVDNTFTYGTGITGGNPVGIYLDSNGKVLVGGIFTAYDGNAVTNFVRINTDGSYDSSFIQGTGFNGSVVQISAYNNVNFMVGSFTNYNGTSANGIVSTNQNGSINASFVYGTGFDNTVFTIAVQSDAKLIIGGFFTLYNGTAANKIIRLNPDGSVDTSFVYGSGFDNNVISLAIQDDGKILIAGNFTTYNGTSANGIIRLNPDGSVDTSFVYGSGFNNNVASVIVGNGVIICGGNFTSYNGNTSNFVAKLNLDGSYNTSWNLGTGFNNLLAAQDGLTFYNGNSIFATGGYTQFDGQTANRISNLLI